MKPRDCNYGGYIKNNYSVYTGVGTQIKNYFHDLPRAQATRVVFNFLYQ